MTYSQTESALRKRANRHNLRVLKSSARNLHTNNKGGYQLLNDSNLVIAGVHYDIMTLDQLAYWIDHFTIKV